MTEDAGTVVAERYTLSEVIGRGNQGVVWRAIDGRTGRSVAIKMLMGLAARDRQLVARLRREREVMKVLEGTSAVGAIDLCASPSGFMCLVMELLEGIDLDRHLRTLEARGERVSLDFVLETLPPIVSTLEAAHAAGIVHRDLKPANLFLVSEAAGGGIRLLDFGLARLRAAAPLTVTGTVIGSPAYIAPEVWKGKPDLIDHRADVYSFGVLVFRVLTGKLPFDAPTLPEQLQLVTTAPRPKLTTERSDLPEAIDAWIARALAVAPESRFDNVRVMWSSLELCAASKRRGIRGIGAVVQPIASAWKAARSAVERIAGRVPTPPPPPPREAEPTPLTPEVTSIEASIATETDTEAEEVDVAPVGLPKLPPPPRRAAPVRGVRTVAATPEAGASDDTKTLLWIRPPPAGAASESPAPSEVTRPADPAPEPPDPEVKVTKARRSERTSSAPRKKARKKTKKTGATPARGKKPARGK